MIIDFTNVTEAIGAMVTAYAGVMVIDGEATCVDGWADNGDHPLLIAIGTFCEYMNIEETEDIQDTWAQNIEVGHKYEVLMVDDKLQITELT